MLKMRMPGYGSKPGSEIFHSMLLVGLLIFPAFSLTIFDGTPKIVANFHQASWQLGSDLENWFGWNQYDYLSVDAGNYSDIPVNDNLEVDGWLRNFDVTKIREEGDTTPVIMILSTGSTPIDGPNDQAGIDLAITKIQKATRILKEEHGIAEVFVSTKHYRFGRAKWGSDWYDGRNDPYIIQAYNETLDKPLGIDVMTPSRTGAPYTWQTDLEHPTAYLHRFYTSQWMKAFYRYDGKEEPAIIEEDLQGKRERAIADFEEISLSIVSPTEYPSMRIGQEVTIDVSIPKETSAHYNVILLAYHNSVVYQYLIKEVEFEGLSKTVTFTIPETAEMDIYSPEEGTMLPVVGDSARIQVFKEPGWQRAGIFAWSEPFLLLDSDGNPTIPPSSAVIPLKEVPVVHQSSARRTIRCFGIGEKANHGLPPGSFDLTGRALPVFSTQSGAATGFRVFSE